MEQTTGTGVSRYIGQGVSLAALAAACATLVALALPAGAQTLGEAVARAAALDPAITTLRARGGEVDASRTVAGALFPAPPALAASLRRDRPDQNLGRNEVDVDVGLPLWLPGQRDLRARLAEREGEELATALAEVHWQLAGRVREAWWALAAARAEAAAAQRRTATLVRIEADIARRVAAGVLARADLLLAQAEVAGARAAADSAAMRVEAATRAWQALTGDTVAPAHAREAGVAAPADGDAHPALSGARSRVELARAQLSLAVGVRRDPPELALQHRSDRDGYGADYRNTVRVALRIPLGTDARNAPRIAAAGTALAQAEAILLHLRRRLDVDRAHALAALDAAERQVRLSSDRLALAREHEALVERAFAMGEQSLVALLRSAALREDAQAETERAEIGVGLMRSRLAQVSGVMP